LTEALSLLSSVATNHVTYVTLNGGPNLSIDYSQYNSNNLSHVYFSGTTTPITGVTINNVSPSDVNLGVYGSNSQVAYISLNNVNVTETQYNATNSKISNTGLIVSNVIDADALAISQDTKVTQIKLAANPTQISEIYSGTSASTFASNLDKIYNQNGAHAKVPITNVTSMTDAYTLALDANVDSVALTTAPTTPFNLSYFGTAVSSYQSTLQTAMNKIGFGGVYPPQALQVAINGVTAITDAIALANVSHVSSVTMVTNGLYRETYTGQITSGSNYLNLFNTLTPNATTTTNTLNLNGIGIPDSTSYRYSGYFVPQTTGSYSFFTSSDDGSFLYLGSAGQTVSSLQTQAQSVTNSYSTTNLIVNNSGEHGNVSRQSSAITLTAGIAYPIVVYYHEGGGGYNLNFGFNAPNNSSFTQDGTGFMFSGASTGGISVVQNTANGLAISNVGTLDSAMDILTNYGAPTYTKGITKVGVINLSATTSTPTTQAITVSASVETVAYVTSIINSIKAGKIYNADLSKVVSSTALTNVSLSSYSDLSIFGNNSSVSAITLTSTSLSDAQYQAANHKITNNGLVISAATAQDAASLITDSHISSIQINDTVANVQQYLITPSLSSSKIASLTLTDTTIQRLSLSNYQSIQNLSPGHVAFTIVPAISDTAANYLSAIATNSLPSGATFYLAADATVTSTQASTLNGKAGFNADDHKLTLSDAPIWTVAQAIASDVNDDVRGYSIKDTYANVSANLNNIAVKSAASVSLTGEMTIAQLHSLPAVNGTTVSLAAHDIKDTPQNLATLTSADLVGGVTYIKLLSAGTLTYSQAQTLINTTGFNANSFKITVSDTQNFNVTQAKLLSQDLIVTYTLTDTTANLIAVNTSTSAVKLASTGYVIADTSANIATNLDAIQALGAKLTFIHQTSTAPLVISYSQLTSDVSALAKIDSGAYTLTVTNVPTVSNAVALISNSTSNHVTSISLSSATEAQRMTIDA
jgi:hypothetical protein